jgi:branched-chain amino acid transport system ATP-binding protein
MPLLDVRELHSGYSDVPVLHGLSFHVNAGEIVTIVGSNGAGKTTLLRTISGLLAPSAGRILLEGEAIHGLQPHVIVGKGLVQVPEGRQLFGNLTVRENLIVGSHSKEARQRCQQTLGMSFDLFPVLAERQKQGAMACPALLMLDEPSWGLAPILVRRLFETIEQNVYRALSMAHRAYVLERGVLVRQGGGKEMLEDPDLKPTFKGTG